MVDEAEPLPPRLADLAALTGRRPLVEGERWDWPSAEELPEVRALAGERWRPLEPAPLYWCLPAVWPPDHRCWVPDRLPRLSRGFQGAHRWLEPWAEETDKKMHADLVAEAAVCGLPEPPRGRLWLVRSPWPSLGVRVVLHLLARRCVERGLPVMTSGVTEAARELLGWSEERIWKWWSGPDADVANAWRARGRVGEEAARLVLAKLKPEDVEALTSGDGGDGGLTLEQALTWCAAVRESGSAAVARVLAWRALGLPAEPPYDPSMVLAEMPPEEAAEWLAAAFDFHDLGELRGLQPANAVAWRDQGFAPSEVRRLLEADRILTPEEAAAFDAAGIEPDARRQWVADGFDADAARAWTDLDILSNEARVWRSIGRGPEDAASHIRAGGGPLPPGARAGWTAIGGHDRADRRYGVIDPPGTRGRTASQTTERGRPAWRP